ncbi:DNA cross-link repair protein PSO2/SNM1 [Parahypoxylon ruwenzoriense]
MPIPTATKSMNPRRQSKLNFGPAKGSKDAVAKTPTSKRRPANGNILNFFKKVEVEEQLFCADPTSASAPTPAVAPPASKELEDVYGIEDDAKEAAHEFSQSAPKRRKLSHDGDVLEQTRSTAPEPAGASGNRVRRKGPFLDESDSEDDGREISPSEHTTDTEANITASEVEDSVEKSGMAFAPNLPMEESCPEVLDIPPLKQGESTYEEFKDLEDMEGLFDNVDEFDDGEEFRERRFMEEQARLEAEEAGNYTSDGIADEFQDIEGVVESCPLCNVSLIGITPDQATVHVNACLDGNPIPLPNLGEKPPSSETVGAPEVSKRFARAAVPRPGQANPISLGTATSQSTSAFSKLMSGHAENAAWASAAASEQSSRGKPAYQRTCPFYKIMPGFSICVDAFRYGAVKGCNAYFLSHFHSDHYIGLTANWSHGPIYCSKVTASLVKTQLRTAARWVRELEFEETVNIPGTEGATVTMLPANHCPGSSLFLFEKPVGKRSNNRRQRILHCGDFRACPAHVTHSLLKPETVDIVSGKVKQQRIDVCYLDTTYLNPRYSFPPQDHVVAACAEFCKSISGDSGAADEVLSGLRQEKGNAAVTKLLQKGGKGSSAAAGGETQRQKNRLLVICGTYSIGKERICKAIAQALGTKIFASPSKIKICSQLGDPELTALLTSNPLEAQVHMQMLMEIRAETLQEYLNSYKPHFTRIVGFRPSGWNFRGGNSGGGNSNANASPGSVPTTGILHGPAWKTQFGRGDLVAQRGSTREAMCFGVPYSEHSSFRELALFLMALRIEKVVPTVNVGSEGSRRRMKGWIDRWLAERRKGGVVRVLLEGNDEGMDGDGRDRRKEELVLWEGRDGRGGAVRW